MRILVLGASGIIGSSMRLAIPPGVEAIFARRQPSTGYISFDATKPQAVHELIGLYKPRAVINLAGESNTDTVEKSPDAYRPINVGMPETLAEMCEKSRLVHVSSQAVFSGDYAPYGRHSEQLPVNHYGFQKMLAERAVERRPNTVIIRPTFVLGIRPDPSIGRQNPIEAMLGGQKKQVSDRYFSVSFAPDVAACIWFAATEGGQSRIIHAGIPHRTSRYQIACDLGLDVEPVSHLDFPGLAPRPVDTTYSVGEYRMGYAEGLRDCLRRWEAREAVAA